jgi:hypothetical protein
MGLPQAAEARLFYQAARQRFEDAELLWSEGRNTGSVYLAGYAVECILKALILASIAEPGKRKQVQGSFRGSRAHDFAWLRFLYLSHGGPSLPVDAAKQFARVNLWSTDLRYSPGTLRRNEAAAVLEAARGILNWADGRL